MTNVYGIVGNPVDKSLSPTYFNDKFKRLGLPSVYKRFPLTKVSEIENLFDSESNLIGLNVTSPFKERIIPYLDECSADSIELNSVNTITLVNGKKWGYNTDVIGFKATYDSLNLKKQKCLVLGTGGAASAVMYVLANKGISYLQVSRTPAGLQIGYREVGKQLLENYPVIINTTPLGMSHQAKLKPHIPYRHIGEHNMLIDLVYEPRVTAFLKEGLKRGARIKNGFQMLVEQAEASWRIWSHNV